MDEQKPAAPRPIDRPRLRWLAAEMSAWQADGIITADQAAAIRGQYDPDELMEHRSRSRVFFALCALAVVLCSGGILSLILSPWKVVPLTVEVVAIVPACTAAFVLAFGFHRRRLPHAAELTALAGAMLLGGTVFLVGELYGLKTNDPTLVLTWMIGTAVVAWLSRSRVIGALTLVLLGVWISMRVHRVYPPPPTNLWDYWSVLLFVAGALFLRRLGSAPLHAIFAVDGAIWLACNMPQYSAAPQMMLLLGVVYTLALPGVVGDRAAARAWRAIGIALMLGWMPLFFTAFLGIFASHAPSIWAVVIAAALLGVGIAAPLRSWVRYKAPLNDWPVIVAGLAAVLTIVGSQQRAFYITPEVPLAVGVLLGAWLIVRGVRLDSSPSFFTGVAYTLLIMLMKWTVTRNSSTRFAVISLLCGMALFAAAWFWRQRRKVRGVTHAASGVAKRGTR